MMHAVLKGNHYEIILFLARITILCSTIETQLYSTFKTCSCHMNKSILLLVVLDTVQNMSWIRFNSKGILVRNTCVNFTAVFCYSAVSVADSTNQNLVLLTFDNRIVAFLPFKQVKNWSLECSWWYFWAKI